MAIGSGEAVLGRMLDEEQAQAALQRLHASARRTGAMQEALERLQAMARGHEPVWLLGEAGSGRNTAAMALHALSERRDGPLLLVHACELLHLVRLMHVDPTEVQQRLWQLDHSARNGTLVVDEGGTLDPTLEALLLQLLGLRMQSRLVLLSTLRGPDQSLSPDLLPYLGPRSLTLPPLRQRGEEIVPLCNELLRLGTPAPPGFLPDGDGIQSAEPDERTVVVEVQLTEDAEVLLGEQDFAGNLWQLRHGMQRLARAGLAMPLTGDEIRPYLAPEGADPHERVQMLRQMALALADLLRPLVPILHVPVTGLVQDLPWAPLLLYRIEDEAPAHYRMGLGPAPMDEGRLVAGLQARPLGPVAGSRTGDVAALGRLGPMWRGNLLALLRAAQAELSDPTAPYLDLQTLSQLLLLAGPPLPAGKLVRLLLYLPVELQDEETEALLSRLQGRTEQGLLCQSPALGLLWADALRGLVPRDEQEHFFAHAVACERCAQVVLSFFYLTGVLRPGEASQGMARQEPPPQQVSPAHLMAQASERAPAGVGPSLGEVYEVVEQSRSDKTEVRIGTMQAPQTLLAEVHGEAGPADQGQEQGQAPGQAQGERQEAPADPVTRLVPLPLPPPQSSVSPLPAPSLLSLMRPQHYLLLSLGLLLVLLLGTVIGMSLAHR